MDGLYCYIFGWVTGLLFMLMEKENRCVRFHAMQSIVTFGTATALLIVFNVLGGLRYVGVLFEVLYWLTIALAVVLWLILMVKSYQGKRVRLPIAGNFAEKHI